MAFNDLPRSTGSSGRVSRRRSLSEGCNLHLLAAIVEGQPLSAESEGRTAAHPFQSTPETPATLEKRSKSESFICTAQGVVFQDTKGQQCQARLERLVELARNPACSSQSNALLAKKALRFRGKALERRRAYS
jgi:hypothetical protein